jgi:V8-like Glu-specific endopeptidase
VPSLLLIGCFVANCHAQGLQTGITHREDIHANEISLASTGVLWVKDIDFSGARYLRIFFKGIRSTNSGTYHVRFLNSVGDTLLDLPKERFERASRFVTGEIPGSFVEVQLISDAPSPNSTVSFDIYETGFDALLPSVLSTPPAGSDLQTINDFKPDNPIRKVAQAVARLSIAKPGGDGSDGIFACTAFLIAKDILATNYHCVQNPDDCLNTTAYFSQVSERGEPGQEIERSCDELIEAVYSSDIAIFRIGSQAGGSGKQLSSNPLAISDRKLSLNESLTILGHPNGKGLEVSQRNCSVKTLSAPGMWALNNTDFGHVCTTAEGSSGSPVFDKNYKVVGLHHLGEDASGRWATENRAVKASSFSNIVQRMIDISKSK